MFVEDMTIGEFIEELKNGQKLFKGVCIENYNFTLEDSDLNDVEFISSFVNFNFKNCSMRKTKFVECNLKCIILEDCDLSESLIDECSIESIEIRNCNLSGILFGTNYAYGNTLTSDECLEMYKNKNAT